MAETKLNLKTVDELIEYQDEFIGRYVEKYHEPPYIDLLIREALGELREVKESERV